MKPIKVLNTSCRENFKGLGSKILPSGSEGQRINAVAQYITEHNAKAMAQATLDASGRMVWDKDHTPVRLGEDFSIGELFYACTGSTALPENSHEFRETVGTGAFAKITQKAISPEILKAYQNANRVWDKLATQVGSDVEKETVPGIDDDMLPELVVEGQEYPSANLTERYVTITNYKYGKTLPVTMELVRYDQTGEILRRARMIGERGADFKDKVVVHNATDQLAGTAKAYNTKQTHAYYLSGTGTDLYAAGNSNVKTSNALADETDIDAAWQILAAQTDANSNPITVDAKIILVPKALAATAFKIRGSSAAPSGSNSGEVNPFGPGGLLNYEILSSVYMADTTTWFLGDFMSQMRLQRVNAPTVSTDTAGGFQNDTMFNIKFSELFGIGAVDHRFVCKSSA